MPSCLGFYTDKNMIKYAKVNRDKNSGLYMLESYGVKFYDNIMTTIDEIAGEVGVDQSTVSLAVNNEGYQSIEVFSGLKAKDRNGLVESEFQAYCEKTGLIPSTLEFRYQLVENTGDIDKFNAICAYVSKSELANLKTNYEGFKISSVGPLGLSINNLFKNKGVDEESVIVNIENKTTVTVLFRGEVQKVIAIPLGMEDVLDRLAEKYNSYSKAYEACKKVSVYIEDVTSLDEESRDILDVILPVFYDIRQRVDNAITPYKKQIKAVYLSGTAVTVNNVDLYFQENFPSLRCEILKPFFAQKRDSGIQKEIVEVNSAIATALNGLGMIDHNIDFNSAANKIMRTSTTDAVKNIKSAVTNFTKDFKAKHEIPANKSAGAAVADKFKDLFKGKYSRGRSRGKVRVAYDAEVTNQLDYENLNEGIIQTETSEFDAWLIRLTVASIVVSLVYLIGSSYVTKSLKQNIVDSDIAIAKVNAEILKANEDAEYIRTRASEYSDKISKLITVMEEIETEKRKSNFDIPNFMSQLMFIIPQGVTITNINISELGEVEIDANSTQYAQLGYFVSRLKLEKILLNVDMSVVEMQQNIKIKVGGMLP